MHEVDPLWERDRARLLSATWRWSIIAMTFTVGLILGAVVTGLAFKWPLWLFLVLAVGVVLQAVIWGGHSWKMRALRRH